MRRSTSDLELRLQRGRRLAAALPLAIVLATGCGGGKEPRVPVFPASGMVLVDGQPARGVELRFHPADALDNLDALRPSATSGEDGSFRVGTYERDEGAPAGRYKVTLFLPDKPPTSGVSPDDLLGGQYTDPARSRFEVTIKEGENRLGPFEVKKAAGRPGRPKKPAKPDVDGLG